jgi:capsid protein
MDEIYEDFIISCVLKGKISIQGFWDDKDKYFNHEWIKRPKKWIDPAKEANADKIALEIGEKTFADLAAERGKDWREQIDELAEIQEYAKSKGVNLMGGNNDTAAGKN